MTFGSLTFVCIFLPVFFLLYYMAGPRRKNFVLLIGNLCFYIPAVWEYPWQLTLLLASLVTDFYLGLWIYRKPRSKNLLFAAGLLLHLAVLGGCKYALGILPLGLSFYTFQGISYLADVRRRKVYPEEDLVAFSAYYLCFALITSGPITRYEQIRAQLHKRPALSREFGKGLETFVIGLGLKVLLANHVSRIWTGTAGIGYESVSTALAWMAAYAYSFRILFDFAGYSMMAIGIGQMLGLPIPQNFDRPYLSKTMTVFWRRWHMTLGAWFRDYVYIPLGGSRKGAFRTILNLAVVWLLTGIWHGSTLNFLLWGGVLFAVIFLEKFLYGRFLERSHVLGHLYMLLLIPLSWSVFAITDLTELELFFTRLFPFFGMGPESPFPGDWMKYLNLYGLWLGLCALFVTPLPKWIYDRLPRILKVPVLLAILGLSLYSLYLGAGDPFLYSTF